MAGGGGGPTSFVNAMMTAEKGAGTPTSTTPTQATTPTARAYENLYGLTFAPPTATYFPQQARSNYDPMRAQRMADASLAYQKAGAAANEAGYNKTLQAWQSMKDAQAAKIAAEKAAAERKAAEEAALSRPFGFLRMSNSSEAAQGGLASLQGFIR